MKLDSQIVYERVSPTTHTFRTTKTLCIQHNEMLSIDDFLKQLHQVWKFFNSVEKANDNHRNEDSDKD